MAETIAGFELVEGVSITELDAWPSFAEWLYEQTGDLADAERHREMFEAYLAGAHWQWQRQAAATALRGAPTTTSR